jgi:hypothetical protein
MARPSTPTPRFQWLAVVVPDGWGAGGLIRRGPGRFRTGEGPMPPTGGSRGIEVRFDCGGSCYSWLDLWTGSYSPWGETWRAGKACCGALLGLRASRFGILSGRLE